MRGVCTLLVGEGVRILGGGGNKAKAGEGSPRFWGYGGRRGMSWTCKANQENVRTGFGC